MKYTKYIRRDFHSVTLVMPQGWDFRVLEGGSKTLAWEFAIAPHRLHILVYRYYGDFDWSMAKSNPFLHFDKNL